ncbi:MAG: UDP-glucose/GDP-mannose dehydrogenase family protein, partial [Acidimicrobiales bacterium]
MSEITGALEPVALTVLGAGYVGLPTAVCLAAFGHSVVCCDVDVSKIESLARGVATVDEEGLQELLDDGISSGRLRFVVDSEEAVVSAEIVFLCLPTPQLDDGSVDVSTLEAAVQRIGPRLKSGVVVVTKSTVPMGQAQRIREILGRDDVEVVSNPEFLREGHAIYDTINPERIVVGAQEPDVAERVGKLLSTSGAPLLITDSITAEAIKYASNAFLAAKLSFVNEVANLCEAVGADSEGVLHGMSFDHRIGADYLRPSPGWGGPCLSKDAHALVNIGQKFGYDFALVRTAIEVNERQKDLIGAKIRSAVGGDLAGRIVAVWGITFKAGTDDLRNSPAVEITRRLASEGALVQAYDPSVHSQRPELSENITVHSDRYVACRNAEVLVVLTEWEEFRSSDFDKVRSELAKPNIVDGRNVLDPAIMRRHDFH